MIRYSEQYIDQKDISNVIKTLKSKFMLYNGNGNGGSGVGIAKLIKN
jgi:hypothetical protein